MNLIEDRIDDYARAIRSIEALAPEDARHAAERLAAKMAYLPVFHTGGQLSEAVGAQPVVLADGCACPSRPPATRNPWIGGVITLMVPRLP